VVAFINSKLLHKWRMLRDLKVAKAGKNGKDQQRSRRRFEDQTRSDRPLPVLGRQMVFRYSSSPDF
jgi:hypothetical protein